MAQFALADNVKETTTTTGIGTVSLGGAFNASSKTFVNGIGSGKITAYKVDDGAGNWENRYGVITSGAPDTITNAGFISSSTGVAVNFLSGTKTVTCVPMPELVLTAAISPVLVETSIASATTTDLGSIQTLRALITGTTTITGFGASPNTLRFVRFAGALTLTHNATSLILLPGVSRSTAVGAVGLYVCDGSGNWLELFYSNSGAVSTRQVLTSGSSATYTTPAGVRQIRICMYGGGGGGAANVIQAGGAAGGAGGDTIFNGIHAGGGKGGTEGVGSAGTGGSSATGTASLRLGGAPGVPGNWCSTTIITSAIGGNGGGHGAGIGGTTAGGFGGNAQANSGGGGGGQGITASGTGQASGSGGGQGEYVEIIINSPSATYTYTIGAGGTDALGSTGNGNGGSGVIIVDEYY